MASADLWTHSAAIRTKTFLGLVAACFLSLPAFADDALLPPAGSEGVAAAAPSYRQAQFLGQGAPDAVHHMADWVTDSQDNKGLPFVIIDKPAAKVFVFDKDAKLLGSAWALIGLAPGDDSLPGIGTMPLSAITPDMRNTPAGRFVAGLGHDLGKLDVLWVDYKDAISMHRVINTNPAEQRLKRIVSPAPADHRISYGCINVPAKFFDKIVDPTFKDTRGVVYILPEVRPMGDFFPAYYEVEGHIRPAATVQAANPVPAADPSTATPASYPVIPQIRD